MPAPERPNLAENEGRHKVKKHRKKPPGTVVILLAAYICPLGLRTIFWWIRPFIRGCAFL
jgi:hypothetical protein